MTRAYIGIAALLAAHFATAAESWWYCETADINADGAVDVSDALLQATCLAELNGRLSPQCSVNGDMDSDSEDMEYVIAAVGLCQGWWTEPVEICGESEVNLPPYQPANQPYRPLAMGWFANFQRAKIGFDGLPNQPDCNPYSGVCGVEVTLHFVALGYSTLRINEGDSFAIAPPSAPDGTPPVTLTAELVELQGEGPLPILWVEWCANIDPPD